METQATKQPLPLDERERFLKRYDLIADIQRTYLSNVTWTAGIFVLAIGWFLNSSSSRAFIHDSTIAFAATTGGILLIAILHFVASWVYYVQSKLQFRELEAQYDDLALLPYNTFRITPSIFVLNLLLNEALALGLFLLVLAARYTAPISN